MRVRLIINSTMKNFLPTEYIDLILPEHATLADLFDELGTVAGESISSSVWNQDKKRFRGPIIVRSGSSILKDEHSSLYDGQEVEIKRFLIGG